MRAPRNYCSLAAKFSRPLRWIISCSSDCPENSAWTFLRWSAIFTRSAAMHPDLHVQSSTAEERKKIALQRRNVQAEFSGQSEEQEIITGAAG